MCGLEWSPDDRELASGGNDNQLYVWNAASTNPLVRFSDHVVRHECLEQSCKGSVGSITAVCVSASLL